MFCQRCGTSMADAASACPRCNTPTARAGAGGATAALAATSTLAATGAMGSHQASAMADTVKAAYGSGLAALKGFAGDPVGRLPSTYDALGDDKARRIGITYGVVSVLCFLLGGYLLMPFKDGLFDMLGFGGVMKAVLFGVIPFACLAAGGMGVRKVFGGQGGTGGDLFVAGAALLPMSFAMVVNGLLGYENYSVMAVVSVFAGCTCVLMLFSGYSRVAKLTERATTVAIPIVVVLTIWLGQLIASSVLESSFGGPGLGGMGGMGGYNNTGNMGGFGGWGG